MFVLMLMKDTIRLSASQLTDKIRDSCIDQINIKYSNKVNRTRNHNISREYQETV